MTITKIVSISVQPQKFLCASVTSPSHPSLFTPFTTTHLLHVTIGQFAFFRLLRKWNHTVYALCLLLLSIIILRGVDTLSYCMYQHFITF